MMPRRFDHRSLGIGHTKPSAVILAATDALLDDVGSRIASDLVGDLAADPVRGALLTYVESIDDLVVEVDPAAYRASLPEPEPEPELAPAPPRPVRTNRIAVIAPLASLAAAVALIGCIALANRSSSPINPSPPHDTAAVQSHALLRHADLLLTAAQRASSTNRKWLVKQAQADLTHAVTLLPLTPPTARPDLRQQIQSLRAEITTQQQPGTGSHQTRPSHSTGHTQQSNDPSGGTESSPHPRTDHPADVGTASAADATPAATARQRRPAAPTDRRP
jgi:hypothetical protein